jgi:hypothetical protein
MSEAETSTTTETSGGESAATNNDGAAKLKEMAHALDAAGLQARVPSNMRYHGDEKAATEDADADAHEPKPAPQKRPNPYEPPADLTQRKLADSYAAYVRKSTKLAKQEAAFSERTKAHEAEVETLRQQVAALATEREAYAFLEKDPAAFLDAYAKRRGMPRSAVYDRLLGAALSDGKLAPEDKADDMRREVDALKKAREEELAQREHFAKQHEIGRAIHGQKVNFIVHLRDESEGAYPLLLEEAKADPEAAASKAYEIGRAAHQAGQTMTVAQVAAEMERQLKYIKWQEDQEAKANRKAGAADTSDASAVEAKRARTILNRPGRTADGHSPKPPKTITSKMVPSSSGDRGVAFKSEKDRMHDALAAWGKH